MVADKTPAGKALRLSWNRQKDRLNNILKFNNLQVLHWNIYPLESKLPNQIFELKQLQEFSINHDSLENPIRDFKRLKKLKRLGLNLRRHYSKRGRELYFDISKLPNLEAVALASFDNISAIDLDRLSQMPKLKELYLHNSWFQSFPSRANAFQQLEKLLITISPRRRELPKALAKFPNLKDLHIQASFLKEQNFEVLESLVGLEKLTIERAQLDDFPESIKKLQSLKALAFIGTNCNNWQKGINQLSKLPKLEEITLPNNARKADYSSLKKVKRVNIWEGYYSLPPILGVTRVGTPNFNLDWEQLIPSLQTFSHLESIEILSKGLDCMIDLLAVLEKLNDVPFSPIYQKKKECLDWFRQKLSPTSLIQFEKAVQ